MDTFQNIRNNKYIYYDFAFMINSAFDDELVSN